MLEVESKPIPPPEEEVQIEALNNGSEEEFDGEEPAEIDILAEFAKPTDKDRDSAKPEGEKPRGEDTASTVIQAATVANNTVNADKALFTATLTVNAINVAGGLVLQAIADEWDEEGERKYTLSPARKKEIIEPLTDLLKQRAAEGKGKPANPVLILVITILISYVPMVVNALRTRKEKTEAKRALLMKQKKEQAGINSGEPKAEINTDLKEENTGIKFTPEEIRAKVQAIKSKKGRRSLADSEFMKSIGLEGE